MAAFRFRAAVVLDLRAREEQAALADLTRAQARFRDACGALDAAAAQRAAAQADLAAVQRRGSDPHALVWHRNWIDRLAGQVDLLRRDRDDRAREVHEAERQWRHARRRRLAIERLRDRAWQRYQRDELRREQQAMDELARLRHVMPDVWRSEP